MIRCSLPLLAPAFLLVALADEPAEDLRVPPMKPADSLVALRLRPGFRAQLVAAEPLVRDPVACDFDENGRLYVAEFPEYNSYAAKGPPKRGAVRLLEDTDGDGTFDRSTLFAEVDSAVAVACYDGGVFVGSVPDLLFLKDTDGDGKADVRKTIYTGFARDKAGEAMLNSFRWGLDNRFHVSTSGAGGDVTRADAGGQRAVSVRGAGFLFDPRTLSFELTSGGGQHGMALDDWGNTFVCSNSDPILLLHYDARYLARNPYVKAPAAAVSIAPEGKFTKLHRISPDEPWRVLRTKLRASGKVPGSDEGGKPSGFFTGATGVTIYRGHAWPAEYRGHAFVGEVANNLLHRAVLEPKGVSLVARRADEGAEFLASRDRWFRPVQLANAPDGNLYVLDMYRELIEGAAFLPEQVLKHLDPASGDDRGRIYRIVPEGFKQPAPPRLGKATTAELVALLEHPGGWHRDTASRLLYQRQDRAAVEPLRKLAAGSPSPLGRTHALYALDGLGALRPEEVVRALGDPHRPAREHAVRLAEKFASEPEVRSKLLGLTEDEDVRVRYQLAFSLGLVKGEPAVRALVRLAVRDGADRWFQLAVLTSAGDRAGELLRRLSAEEGFRKTPHGVTLLRELAGQVGSANRGHEVAAVLKAVGDLPDGEKKLAAEIVRALAAKLPAEGRKLLQGAEGGKAGDILADLLAEALKTAADEKANPARRASAVRSLGLAPFARSRALFEDLLNPRQPQPVQKAALEALAGFDEPEVPGIILAAWPAFSPQLRATATETLFSRRAWLGAFLDAVAEEKVRPGDVDPARVQLLQSSPDAAVRARAKKLFGKTVGGREEVVKGYRKALDLKGDAGRGKEVFAKSCAACHRLEGVGEEVGADLKAVRDRGTEAVLLNILDPNREVKPQYLSYYLTTKKGRTLTGMITAETANSITLRRPDGTSETVLRIDIDELSSSGMSYMPEGLEKQIDVRGMADLLAYLNSIR